MKGPLGSKIRKKTATPNEGKYGKEHPRFGKTPSNIRKVAIIKDEVILQKFNSVNELWNYIRNNYPAPNGRKFIFDCLRENRGAHGLKFIYIE